MILVLAMIVGFSVVASAGLWIGYTIGYDCGWDDHIEGKPHRDQR